MVKYYIGVDGGGTNSRMRLADSDLKTLAQVEVASPSNLQVRDGDAAFEAISELTETVFEKAGLPLAEAKQAAACFGVAGGRLQSAREEFAARDFPFSYVTVLDDIDIARAGAHGTDDGGVMIIGTGSAALALVDGQRYQAGGWGFHVGDRMSGAILGREALRLSIEAHDGLRPQTDMSRAIMAHFHNAGEAMMDWSFDNDAARKELLDDLPEGTELPEPVPARPRDYGEFARLVTQYAQEGDALAKELMEFELSSIALYVDWFKARNVKSIAIVGGLGRYLLPQLKARFGDIITEKDPDPLYGALVLARQHAEDPSQPRR